MLKPSFHQLRTFALFTMRKAPGGGHGKGEKSKNQDFVDFLFELSNYEKNVSRNTFKSNAYRKVSIKKLVIFYIDNL